MITPIDPQIKVLSFNTKCYILVTYATLQKGASKHHKTDEKSTHFAVHVSPSIFNKIKNFPTILRAHLIAHGYYKKKRMLTEKRAPPFFSSCFGLVLTPETFISC